MKLQEHIHIGKRDNNEDSLGHNSHTYLVCDGVGGNAKGEVASSTIVNEVLALTQQQTTFSKSSIQELLVTAQQTLNKKLEEMPLAEGMGTTLCGVFKDENAYYFAHIGDSRIYWLRPSTQQIWHTWDHSIVGELVRNAQISREEGRNHPMGNRISRAIIANRDDKTTKAEITKATNVKQGDLLFICSDGVNEAWEEYHLINLLLSNQSLASKKEAIAKQCEETSRDNNTFYLLEIEAEDALNGVENEEITWLSATNFMSDGVDYTNINEPKAQETKSGFTIDEEDIEICEDDEDTNKQQVSTLNKPRIFLIFTVISLVLFAIIFNMFSRKGKAQKETPTTKSNVTKVDNSNEIQENPEKRPSIRRIDNAVKEPTTTITVIRNEPVVENIDAINDSNDSQNKEQNKDTTVTSETQTVETVENTYPNNTAKNEAIDNDVKKTEDTNSSITNTDTNTSNKTAVNQDSLQQQKVKRIADSIAKVKLQLKQDSINKVLKEKDSTANNN